MSHHIALQKPRHWRGAALVCIVDEERSKPSCEADNRAQVLFRIYRMIEFIRVKGGRKTLRNAGTYPMIMSLGRRGLLPPPKGGPSSSQKGYLVQLIHAMEVGLLAAVRFQHDKLTTNNELSTGVGESGIGPFFVFRICGTRGARKKGTIDLSPEYYERRNNPMIPQPLLSSEGPGLGVFKRSTAVTGFSPRPTVEKASSNKTCDRVAEVAVGLGDIPPPELKALGEREWERSAFYT